MTQVQPTTQQAYDAADRRLREVTDGPSPRWDAPSSCEGWSATDVVVHVIDAQRDFLAPHGVDLGERADVGADPAAAWRRHADRVSGALADEALGAKPFDGFFGPTTVGATFERFYVWDMLVHRWDLAVALGADADLTGEELDRVEQGADGFGEALHMEGICRPALQVPPGASRQEQVLARLGRGA